ncbi:MAG: MAPEG family protein [Acidocella sp.]|nr:MAPEG family protein [Acidocella sp.]
MNNIPITLLTAGVLGLLYVALSARVVMARAKTNISLGDDANDRILFGGEVKAPKLQIAVRCHANFAEYVPLALILLGGIEAAGAAHWMVTLLAVLLVVARVAHPVGMSRPAPNPFRFGGILLTWVVMGWASVVALLIAL